MFFRAEQTETWLLCCVNHVLFGHYCCHYCCQRVFAAHVVLTCWRIRATSKANCSADEAAKAALVSFLVLQLLWLGIVLPCCLPRPCLWWPVAVPPTASLVVTVMWRPSIRNARGRSTAVDFRSTHSSILVPTSALPVRVVRSTSAGPMVTSRRKMHTPVVLGPAAEETRLWSQRRHQNTAPKHTYLSTRSSRRRPSSSRPARIRE